MKRSVMTLALLPLVAAAGCRDDAATTGTGGAAGTEPESTRSVGPDHASPGLWEENPERRWSLEEELRIGLVEGPPEYVFGRIRNLIPAGDGGVWVYDQQAVELRRFDEDGNHVLSVGRSGEGPGEFSGNACAHPGADGEIWVETETDWHRFDKSGELVGTFRTPSTLACGVRAWLPDGRYLVAGGGFDRESGVFQEYFVVLEWTDGAMIPVDTLEAPDVPEPETITFVNESGRSRSVRRIPFVHAPGWRLEEGGWFWVWDGGGEYELRLQSLRGDTIRRISRPYTPIRIEGDVRRRAIEAFDRPGWRAETEFEPSSVPEVYPPFSTARLAADGSVWVRRQVGENERSWDVFSEEDRLLGRIDMPGTFGGIGLRYIGPDHVWGLLRDDLDVQYVVRARISKPQ